MAVDPKKLIAAISPDIYCKEEKRDEVKEIVKKEGYLKAAKEAEIIDSSFIDINKIRWEKTALDKKGLSSPLEHHTLEYDIYGNPNQILEELYFWILDYVDSSYGKSFKLIDNFIATPGSSLFSENLQKRSTAEQNASRIMGNINEVIKSILNLIYSIKEYDSVLALYDKAHSKDKDERESAIMSLKQRWLDKVDIQKGGSSIKQLSVTGANQPNFVMLIDAFMFVNSEEEVDKTQLNDRIKRLVKQRLQEFLIWLKDSEEGLRKRYVVEKNYLKAQMHSLRMYASWAKPYLKAAQKLQERVDDTNPGLVNAFNTALFELTLMGQGKYKIEGDIEQGEIPKFFKDQKMRDYSPVVLIDMKFRSTPESVGQHARFRGKMALEIIGIGLNEDEIEVLKKEIEKDDLGDAIGAVTGATDDSIEKIQKDVDEIMNKEKEKREEAEKKSKNKDDSNPFSALFSIFTGDKNKTKDKEDEKGEKDLSKGIPKDNDYEKVIRSQVILDGRFKCGKLYSTLKKAYNMPAV